MLKHCSQSCVDVSRRSLRHNSFSLDSRFGLSADTLDQADRDNDIEYRTYCANNTKSFSGMVTLPRNRKVVTDSCLSLPNFSSVSAIKVYAQCLRPHLAYKTVIITPHTTSRQVVLGLLSRFRMKHRDPKLFYLTMEVNIGEERSRTISLEDGTCIADLISCNPWGTSRFRLKARHGGLVKIYDGEVRTDSVYKSIILSENTTVGDAVTILRDTYGEEEGTRLQLFEYNPKTGAERRLAEQERLLEIKEDSWEKNTDNVFQLRRTPQSRVATTICDPLNTHSSAAAAFTRTLVRNSVLRQSIRKKQFFKSMIVSPADQQRSELEELDLGDNKTLFSLGRFSLSDQVISEDSEDGGSSDLNCSTSGVSSLSCSSLDSLGSPRANSFFT